MRTDAERFRFIADNRLQHIWDGTDRVVLFWRGLPSPGQPGGYMTIAEGKTLEEAVDNAIARWERKHGRKYGG